MRMARCQRVLLYVGMRCRCWRSSTAGLSIVDRSIFDELGRDLGRLLFSPISRPFERPMTTSNAQVLYGCGAVINIIAWFWK
jgi:hypothetical protein